MVTVLHRRTFYGYGVLGHCRALFRLVPGGRRHPGASGRERAGRRGCGPETPSGVQLRGEGRHPQAPRNLACKTERVQESRQGAREGRSYPCQGGRPPFRWPSPADSTPDSREPSYLRGVLAIKLAIKLATKNMVRTPTVARSISDVGWGEVVKIDRW